MSLLCFTFYFTFSHFWLAKRAQSFWRRQHMLQACCTWHLHVLRTRCTCCHVCRTLIQTYSGYAKMNYKESHIHYNTKKRSMDIRTAWTQCINPHQHSFRLFLLYLSSRLFPVSSPAFSLLSTVSFSLSLSSMPLFSELFILFTHSLARTCLQPRLLTHLMHMPLPLVICQAQLGLGLGFRELGLGRA